MISEPNINKSKLINLLEDNFSFNINTITFNPKGEGSWSYFIVTEDKKYFLKLFKNKDFNLVPFEFTARLFSEYGIQNIVHPIKTNSNEVFITLEDFKLVLFDFIDGKTIREQALSEIQLEELGELLAKVHKSKDIIGAYP